MNNITTLCALKGDKSCAVTFTADDNLYRSFLFYQSRFREYGLKGTVMLTTNFVLPDEKKAANDDFTTWEQWQAFIAEGFFDVGNHTISHPYLDRIPAAQLESEVNEAQALLRQKFPGQKVLCMANPFVVTNDDIDVVIRQQHFSARNGQGGFNSLDPGDNEWFRLNFQTALHHSTAENMNKWIDEAMEKGMWLIEMWHGVDGQGWEPPASAECDKHLYYLSQHLDTVWNGTMEEVTLYIRERQHATVHTETSGESEIQVTLKHDLDPVLFDYPLTLKTRVPAHWEKVALRQGEREEILIVHKKDGFGEVCYDAVPNADMIVMIPR